MGTLTPPEQLLAEDGWRGSAFSRAGDELCSLTFLNPVWEFTMERSNRLSLEVVRRTERQGEMKRLQRPLFKNTAKDSRR